MGLRRNAFEQPWLKSIYLILWLGERVCVCVCECDCDLISISILFSTLGFVSISFIFNFSEEMEKENKMEFCGLSLVFGASTQIPVICI